MYKFKNEYLKLVKGVYTFGGSLAIYMLDKDDCLYDMLTVNLPEETLDNPDTDAFIDTNNLGDYAEEFLEKNGIAKFTGQMAISGFCSYPCYRFNLDKLED